MIQSNRIEANDTSIKKLLKEQKFYIDYFQREYRWQEKHMVTLIEDLTSTFLKSYTPGDKRSEVANYQSYYLGPVVFSVNPDNHRKSIIDGQQRITSLSLLLIFLNHLQKDKSSKVSISEMIFSESYGEKSFNMTDESRQDCLTALFNEGAYTPTDTDDETVRNMVDRYADIQQTFPEELEGEALPYFIDWLIENVVIVNIRAYSDENAYTIFEAMNDRGMNLTATEMLKGYVLSRITDPAKRLELNKVWKEQILRLHGYGDTTDQSFFQHWFRGKYAQSMRPSRAGSENQDFEKIGSRFHSWFKENHEKIFGLYNSDDFYNFFKNQFPFFVKWYLRLWDAMVKGDKNMPHLEYVHTWGIAESLQDPLLLAPVNYSDDEAVIYKKLDAVARFIETYTVRRSVNYRRFGQSSIKYSMFNLVRKIRSKDLPELADVLRSEISDIEESWEGVWDFGLHGQNKKFVKHLLSRISAHLDHAIGENREYHNYHHPTEGRKFQIEHIWADKFEEHRDEFEQESDFREWRNSIGALILLPSGTNQSFNSDRYEDKLPHYLRENTYAKTLHPKFYEKNPNFLKAPQIQELNFKAHSEFRKADLEERQDLVKQLCEQIWSVDWYENL